MNDAIRSGATLGADVAVVSVLGGQPVVLLVPSGRRLPRRSVRRLGMAEVQHLGQDRQEKDGDATQPDDATQAPGG